MAYFKLSFSVNYQRVFLEKVRSYIIAALAILEVRARDLVGHYTGQHALQCSP